MEHTALKLADALAEATQAINQSVTLEGTLDAIVEATRTSVPGLNHVGISVTHRDGRIETRSATGRLVWELDAIQCDLGEGPCVDSIRGADTVIVEHARHDQRWPRYLRRAVQHGLRSQLALRLYDDGKTLGGLNMYSTTSDRIDRDAIHAAELFATHAAIALGHAQHEQDLNEALASRKTIGQAIGILMERYQIDQDRAFQFLTRASSTSNIKLRDVAQELVDSTNAGTRSS